MVWIRKRVKLFKMHAHARGAPWSYAQQPSDVVHHDLDKELLHSYSLNKYSGPFSETILEHSL